MGENLNERKGTKMAAREKKIWERKKRRERKKERKKVLQNVSCQV